ncbi:CheY-like superfamily [Gongronella butleri]|nr:CheY-like superfamily [Gongronella butleri]
MLIQRIPPSPPPSSLSLTDVYVRLLLVDDNPINLQLLKRALETLLMDKAVVMDCAYDGLQALQCLEEHAYDAIFMDIDMPLLNGIETTKRIRASTPHHPSAALVLPSNRGVPIIAVTTHCDYLETKQMYKDIGMNACLGKPIILHQLKTHLFNLLQWA